ncbi:efflux RND transporter periplasmic adaptor subunit [Myroides marinus]|jgi:RND family efflux transporter MFP subunit|uniref:Efflux transporter periplasmic adaptor subunit n=1 Tax=Myroides marinus TaxID=703342 RepID=A0A163Z417_9FLAO|nr:efflux RND transporter periplasmic adaptor subunit [Myroides marinus]KZE80953.1 efflux transporter periplasmic adaptor subunit [Myroides marinus]MDM1369428.1 efflux RND transporter periplasmic adaptor subunit [Myroides marinus]MDM1372873.1 efflux RND transporter periplasmic adaptor subunit [Myroides marinus]MDM1390816.1 efflux RND transporter periplasmic adaptor subunit [Myroides marinus]
MKRIYIALISLVVLTACADKKSPEVAEKKDEKGGMNMAMNKMETISLELMNPDVPLQLPGELRADQRTEIFAKVNSYVTDLKVDIGSVVKKGQVLMILDAPEIQAQVASAQSKWKAQEAIYVSSKATYDRTMKANQTEGAIAPDYLEQVTARMLADKAQVASAKSAYEETRNIDQYLVIRAPFDGVVTDRQVDKGAYVGPMSKLPLLTVEDTRTLRLNLSISEANTPYVKEGDIVKFKVRTLPQKEFTGVVTRKAGSLDLKLRSEQIQADINNAEHLLKPNMIADATVNLKGAEPSFFVPKSALVDSNLGMYVIEVKNGTAYHRKVAKGRVNGMMIEVIGELTAGSKILKMATEEIMNEQKLM